jgi:hypothetical protein
MDAPYLFIATPMYGGMCHGGYTASMLRVTPIFLNEKLAFQYAFTVNESLISRARDSLAHDFLETECTHLMFIDSDIGFQAEDILSMIEANKDIICGIYPRKEVNWEGVIEAVVDCVPAEKLHEHAGLFVVNTLNGRIEDAPSGWPVEVANAGCGFMLIKRHVLGDLAHVVPTYMSPGGGAEPRKVFRQFFDTSIDPDSGVLLSEDFHFCMLARDNGWGVWAAPWVTLTHAGSYLFTGRLKAGANGST